MLLCILSIILLVRSNIQTQSSISMGLKAIYVLIMGACIFMYIAVRNKLAKRMSNKQLSIIISKLYCYMYLAVIVFVSRLIGAYVLKDVQISMLNPSYELGLGSYLNYGLGVILKNQMYANVIINTIIAFVSSIIIKKIMLNITDNDMVATTSSIIYLMLPQSLINVGEYIKYGYNVLLILIGILMFMYIIDEVKKFTKKTNKYLIYSGVFALIQSIDILLGGTYFMWLVLMVITTIAATYVDVVRLKFNFKNKLDYKKKILLERIEKINISKLVNVALITLSVSGIVTIICCTLVDKSGYTSFSLQNTINILGKSRMYYIILIVLILVFDIIAVVLKRKTDIKMFALKILSMVSIVTTAFMIDTTYASAVFDTLLSLNVVISICNICYNREEKIKLLKEVN